MNPCGLLMATHEDQRFLELKLIQALKRTAFRRCGCSRCVYSLSTDFRLGLSGGTMTEECDYEVVLTLYPPCPSSLSRW